VNKTLVLRKRLNRPLNPGPLERINVSLPPVTGTSLSAGC